MLLTVMLPAALEIGGEARVRRSSVGIGEAVGPGARLLDFSVDLSAGVAHDCPPIAHYRLVLRERGWLRSMTVAVGDAITAGAVLALLSTEQDEPLDAAPVRAARVTVASILFHAEGWGGQA